MSRTADALVKDVSEARFSGADELLVGSGGVKEGQEGVKNLAVW